jgi:hypothetical protein
VQDVDISFHGSTRGACSMHKKEHDVEVYLVTFKDGTIRRKFVCIKGVKELLDLKVPVLEPDAALSRGNGEAADA